MKVQDVRKECLATVGLSVEFSNSEVSSLSRLLWEVTTAVEKGIENLHKAAIDAEKQYGERDVLPVTIDLGSLKRLQWLLIQLTGRDMSGLFQNADADYRVDLDYINNIPAVKQ